MLAVSSPAADPEILREGVFPGTPSLQLLSQKLKAGSCRRVVVLLGPHASAGPQHAHYYASDEAERPAACSVSLERWKPTHPTVAAKLAELQLRSFGDLLDDRIWRKSSESILECLRDLWPSGRGRPMLAHVLTKILNDRGLLLRVYTENVDGLERQAAVPRSKIVEMNGTFGSAHCVDCGREHMSTYVKDKVFKGHRPSCTYAACRGLVRPDLLFSGDSKPPPHSAPIESDFAECDCVLVIGSTLSEGSALARVAARMSPYVPRLAVVPAGVRVEPFDSSDSNYRDVVLEADRAGGVGLEEALCVLCKSLGYEHALRDTVPPYLAKRVLSVLLGLEGWGFRPSRPECRGGILKPTAESAMLAGSLGAQPLKRRPLNGLRAPHAFTDAYSSPQHVSRQLFGAGRPPSVPVRASPQKYPRNGDPNQTIHGTRRPRMVGDGGPLSQTRRGGQLKAQMRSSSAGQTGQVRPPPPSRFKPLSAPPGRAQEDRCTVVRFAQSIHYVEPDEPPPVRAAHPPPHPPPAAAGTPPSTPERRPRAPWPAVPVQEQPVPVPPAQPSSAGARNVHPFQPLQPSDHPAEGAAGSTPFVFDAKKRWESGTPVTATLDPQVSPPWSPQPAQQQHDPAPPPRRPLALDDCALEQHWWEAQHSRSPRDEAASVALPLVATPLSVISSPPTVLSPVPGALRMQPHAAGAPLLPLRGGRPGGAPPERRR
eukprot:TRINITY_DN2492_c0_g1_i3.p1 TRINITY_DN2492_c0_g1~~TRINITY_DN2492_c0_g1_i3.p1  ORF type:complete len:711 (+),score=190.02 TRINITY_DN2492_c0_g1_i3:252-2384(+)